MREPATGVGVADRQAEQMRALHAEYSDALWRYALRLTSDPIRAQDVVQETLLRAWKRPEVLEQSDGPVGAWLYTVARNIVIDDQRSARMRREVSTDAPPEQPTADHADAALDRWLVADALDGLSAEHREVIVECYYRGKTAAEVAAATGIPAGTVKSRLHYGLRAMRLVLQEMGVTS
ncbi:RNA polymerase sigma-70 factor [Jatrophihabitans sp. GAS493]|nr:sigma-70 family RNA polymerase sigma factor [Jatrophihabitans sp. GAS493]SOD70691.1 RNA polymerase sigma-70 factor [Jatrophihabitans sp. GAS493]